jgi:hypothetical protein
MSAAPHCRFCGTALPKPYNFARTQLSAATPVDSRGRPSTCKCCRAPAVLTLDDIPLATYLRLESRSVPCGISECNPMLTEAVFEFVPLRTLWTCRAVCRAWCAMSPASRDPRNSARVCVWGERMASRASCDEFDHRLRLGSAEDEDASATKPSKTKIHFARCWISGFCIGVGDVVMVPADGGLPRVGRVAALCTVGQQAMEALRAQLLREPQPPGPPPPQPARPPPPQPGPPPSSTIQPASGSGSTSAGHRVAVDHRSPGSVHNGGDDVLLLQPSQGSESDVFCGSARSDVSADEHGFGDGKGAPLTNENFDVVVVKGGSVGCACGVGSGSGSGNNSSGSDSNGGSSSGGSGSHSGSGSDGGSCAAADAPEDCLYCSCGHGVPTGVAGGGSAGEEGHEDEDEDEESTSGDYSSEAFQVVDDEKIPTAAATVGAAAAGAAAVSASVAGGASDAAGAAAVSASVAGGASDAAGAAGAAGASACGGCGEDIPSRRRITVPWVGGNAWMFNNWFFRRTDVAPQHQGVMPALPTPEAPFKWLVADDAIAKAELFEGKPAVRARNPITFLESLCSVRRFEGFVESVVGGTGLVTDLAIGDNFGKDVCVSVCVCVSAFAGVPRLRVRTHERACKRACARVYMHTR